MARTKHLNFKLSEYIVLNAYLLIAEGDGKKREFAGARYG